MNINYATLELTVPAGGSIRGTILNVPQGKKYNLLMVSAGLEEGYEMKMFINNTIQVDIQTGLYTYLGSYIQLNNEIDTPTTIDIELTDTGGGGATLDTNLMYEK